MSGNNNSHALQSHRDQHQGQRESDCEHIKSSILLFIHNTQTPQQLVDVLSVQYIKVRCLLSPEDEALLTQTQTQTQTNTQTHRHGHRHTQTQRQAVNTLGQVYVHTPQKNKSGLVSGKGSGSEESERRALSLNLNSMSTPNTKPDASAHSSIPTFNLGSFKAKLNKYIARTSSLLQLYSVLYAQHNRLQQKSNTSTSPHSSPFPSSSSPYTHLSPLASSSSRSQSHAASAPASASASATIPSLPSFVLPCDGSGTRHTMAPRPRVSSVSCLSGERASVYACVYVGPYMCIRVCVCSRACVSIGVSSCFCECECTCTCVHVCRIAHTVYCSSSVLCISELPTRMHTYAYAHAI